MAIRQTRKISELNTLTSASLNTYVLGVDNGATYKITLDVLEDAVVNMVSRSTDLRLDSLELYTASYSASSIPNGTISSSAQISNLGFISSSHTDITSLNSFTSSQNTLNSAFTNGIGARLQTSSFNDFSASVHSEIIAATNEQSFNGLVSGSSQLTSSYDERYVLSGSITQTTWDNIANKPDGIVSQSVDIADFTFTNGTITNGEITLHATNSDIVFNADGAVYIGSSNAGNGVVTDGYLAGVIGDTNTVNNSTGHTITDNLTNIINSIPTIPIGTISGSEQITAFGFISSSQTIDTGSLATTGSNTFNGNQTINGSLTINISSGIPTGVSNWNGQGGWNQGFYSNISTTGGTGTGLTVDVAAGGGGYIGIEQITINTAGSGYTNGDIITIDNENNLPGQFTIEVGASSLEFDASGSLVFPDSTIQTTAFTPTIFVTTSSFNSYTASISTGSLVDRLNAIENASGSWITESETGSFLRNLNGAISSSSQLTSSLDIRYATSASYLTTLNGAISSSTQVLGASGIYSSSAQLPSGLVSGSSQLTSSYDTRYTLSGSVVSGTTPTGTISGSAQISAFGFVSGSYTTTASFNAFTASALTTGSNTFSGSQIISGALYVTSITSISSSFSLPSGSSLLILSGSNIYVDSSGSITGSLSGSIFGIGDVVAFSSSVNSRLNSAGGVSGTISGSAQITAFGFVSGSYETTGRSIVSGSSQLTSSYDTRYTLSGSVSAVPSGTISGSSQLTSSYDTRYLVTGSVTSSISQLNTFTASISTASLVTSINNLNTYTASQSTASLVTSITSLNTLTSSLATTGSNSFNGNQTITGSLNVSSMAVVSSSFTTNSSSLYLTSGSNLYVQNNGIVEITGSLKVTGTASFNDVVTFGASSGDEGGEIHLALAQTNNSLTGSINIDVWRNRLRLWEGGGNARGVYVDLSKAPDGVGGELLWKASGLVNTDVDITLGNLKVRIPSTGNKSLQVSTVSGTYSVYGSSVYSYNGIGGVTLSSPLSITTTPTYLSAGYNFTVAGATDTWNIADTSAGIAWRITMMIGPSYNNNMISIERLV